MSASTADDVDDAIGALNSFDDTSKGRRLLDRLSNERVEMLIFGPHPLLRLSMCADSAFRNEHCYDHQRSPPDPPGLGHRVSSSGAEAENAVET
jgi:hypothetical protein